MKQTTEQTIAKIREILSEQESLLAEETSLSFMHQVMLNIYMQLDQCKEVTARFQEQTTVIATPYGISIIHNGRMSYYHDAYTLCSYEDLETDLLNILELTNLVMIKIGL